MRQREEGDHLSNLDEVVNPPSDHPLIDAECRDPVSRAVREVTSRWAAVSKVLRLDLAQASEDVSIALAAGGDAARERVALNEMRATHAAAHQRAATAAAEVSSLIRRHQVDIDRLAAAGDAAYSAAVARDDTAGAEAIWCDGFAEAAAVSERARAAVVACLNSARFDMSLTRRGGDCS